MGRLRSDIRKRSLDLLKEEPSVKALRGLPELRIAISGWSASGKTVYARFLADLLGCEYISASGFLLRTLGFEEVDWIRDRDCLESARATMDERMVDDALLESFAQRARVVLDSWVAPWRASCRSVSVWLDCDLETRTRNASGCEALPPKAREAVREGLAQKDADSVARFRHAYGFDYGPDGSVFDVYLDLSDLISADRTRWPAERATVLTQLANEIHRAWH